MKIPGEYIAVSRALWRLGIGDEATAAHAMSVTPIEAQTIVSALCGDIPLAYRGIRGLAVRPAYGERITLPASKGQRPDGMPYLRLGLVLHECAHVLTWRERPGAPPHGKRFVETFARVLREF